MRHSKLHETTNAGFPYSRDWRVLAHLLSTPVPVTPCGKFLWSLQDAVEGVRACVLILGAELRNRCLVLEFMCLGPERDRERSVSQWSLTHVVRAGCIHTGYLRNRGAISRHACIHYSQRFRNIRHYQTGLNFALQYSAIDK